MTRRVAMPFVTLLIACACCLTSAVAGAQPAPPPPKLEPLPDVPPPAGFTGDEDLQPQVTITERRGEKVEEARVNGRLLWVRVTPRHGRPYYLIPDQGGNTYIRRDSNETGLKVPLWLLFSW